MQPQSPTVSVHTVLALIGAQLVLWTLSPWLVHTSLPLDVVREGLAWGHEWQWGYHKHPPLVSWLDEGFFTLLGDIGPFLLSQIAIATTYWFVFLLGRQMMGETRAAIGTLLLTGIFYFSLPTPEFNHNIAQMPLWAMAAYFFYRATHTPGTRWWLLLGVSIGLGILTKYSTVMICSGMAIYMLARPDLRRRLLTPAPWLGVLTALLICLPHIVWMFQNNFQTLHYAVDRAGEAHGILDRILMPIRFLLTQIADQAVVILLLAIAGLIGKGAFAKWPRWSDDDWRFLIIIGLAPVLLTMLGSFISGYGLRDMWGAPMWNLTGLIAIKGLEGRYRLFKPRRLIVSVAVLLVLLPTAFASVAWFRASFKGHTGRMDWPDRAIAASGERNWRAQTSCPLQIVAGESWLAGLVAMRLSPRPSVLLDGDFAISPWISHQRLTEQGALVVWRIEGDAPPPAYLSTVPGFKALGTQQFDWPSSPKARALLIGWGIVPPARSACR